MKAYFARLNFIAAFSATIQLAMGAQGWSGDKYLSDPPTPQESKEVSPCSIAFSIIGELKSLDREFGKLGPEASVSEARSVQVEALLNKTFFPMMLELNQAAMTASDKEIGEILATLETRSPLISSKFVSFIPRLENEQDPWLKRMVLRMFPDYMRKRATHNATSNIRAYGLAGRKDVGSYSQFLWTTPDKQQIATFGTSSNTNGLNLTPIGPYGEEFARNLLRTNQVLAQLAIRKLPPISRRTFSSSETLIRKRSARGLTIESENTVPEMAPLSAVLEGVFSFHQFVNLILGERIPGIPTGSEALRQIVSNGSSHLGLVTDFTSRLPMGVLGPMNLAGLYFKNPTLRTAAGGLGLSVSLKETLAELKAFAIRKGTFGGICPLAFLFRGDRAALKEQLPAFAPMLDKTGLQLLAESYGRIFERVKSFHSPPAESQH